MVEESGENNKYQDYSSAATKPHSPFLGHDDEASAKPTHSFWGAWSEARCSSHGIITCCSVSLCAQSSLALPVVCLATTFVVALDSQNPSSLVSSTKLENERKKTNAEIRRCCRQQGSQAYAVLASLLHLYPLVPIETGTVYRRTLFCLCQSGRHTAGWDHPPSAIKLPSPTRSDNLQRQTRRVTSQTLTTMIALLASSETSFSPSAPLPLASR